MICKTWQEAWFHVDYWLERNTDLDDYNRYEMIEALVAEHWGLDE